jgi:biotin/lipoyl-binding protein
VAATAECTPGRYRKSERPPRGRTSLITTKFADDCGRPSLVVKEGQLADKGELVARMDTVELEAQLNAAEANC